MLLACSEESVKDKFPDGDPGIADGDVSEADSDSIDRVQEADGYDGDDKPATDGDAADSEEGATVDGDLDGSDGDAAESDTDQQEKEADPDPDPESEPDAEAQIISVLTINLLNPLNPPSLDGDNRNRIVADFINAAQPDFVLNQEVVQSVIVVNRAQMLSDLTGYFYEWEMTHDVPYVFQEGIAILSKWPIAWSEAVQLPHEEFGGLIGDMFTRSVLGVGATTPSGEINVFCSHMTISLDQTKKADQSAAIVDFISGFPSTLPGFFGGDLNATPDSLAMQLTRGESSHNGTQGNFTDAWPAVNGADPGYTSTSEDPTKRIDYIYIVPGSGPGAETVDCELVFTEPVNGLMASDHLGVFCRFAVH